MSERGCGNPDEGARTRAPGFPAVRRAVEDSAGRRRKQRLPGRATGGVRAVTRWRTVSTPPAPAPKRTHSLNRRKLGCASPSARHCGCTRPGRAALGLNPPTALSPRWGGGSPQSGARQGSGVERGAQTTLKVQGSHGRDSEEGAVITPRGLGKRNHLAEPTPPPLPRERGSGSTQA